MPATTFKYFQDCVVVRGIRDDFHDGNEVTGRTGPSIGALHGPARS
jgi:hypothetical protein